MGTYFEDPAVPAPQRLHQYPYPLAYLAGSAKQDSLDADAVPNNNNKMSIIHPYNVNILCHAAPISYNAVTAFIYVMTSLPRCIYMMTTLCIFSRCGVPYSPRLSQHSWATGDEIFYTRTYWLCLRFAIRLT